MPRWPLVLLASLVLGGTAVAFHQGTASTVRAERDGLATLLPYSEAKSILSALPRDRWPEEFRQRFPAENEFAWAQWLENRDRAIRSRVAEGDKDSLFNLLLFGVSFTRLPRATERDVASAPTPVDGREVIRGRVEDLIAGMASPDANERLQFARTVLGREGIDLDTLEGRQRARKFLVDGLSEMFVRFSGYFKGLDAARARKDTAEESIERATVFRDRGLSTDSSIYVDFVVDQALQGLKADRVFAENGVRRVAIVGPGLDFADKREGYDVVPVQTIQPFAIIDSLLRLKLANPQELRVTTFDVSARVNSHIDASRLRAVKNEPYRLNLVRDTEERWTAPLETYWSRFGDQIGGEVRPIDPPSELKRLKVKTVSVRPAVVRSIVARDLNIVLQRLDTQFDVVVATNVFVYYDLFEQSLALANVAGLLRAGGVFLVNSGFLAEQLPQFREIGRTELAYSDRPDSRDRLNWYARR